MVSNYRFYWDFNLNFYLRKINQQFINITIFGQDDKTTKNNRMSA